MRRGAVMDEQAVIQIDAETRSILDRIVKYRTPKRVILFGSRGRGDAKPDSDVDLCILYEHLEKPNIQVMQELYFDFIGHMQRPVDLIVYDEAVFIERANRRNSFESVIEAEGITVYG